MPQRTDLSVTFETRAVINKARSFGEKIVDNENKVVHEIKGSGVEEFDNVPYVVIGIPGDKTVEIDRPATWCGGHPKPGDAKATKGKCRAPTDSRGNPRLEECDVHRFVDEWAAYCEGVEQVAGVPLTKLGLDPASLKELAYFNVHSVEQLAGLTDSNAARFFHHREAAREYLDKDSAKDKQLAEMKERLAALEAAQKPVQKAAVK